MTGHCIECGRIATVFLRNPITGKVEEWCATCYLHDDRDDETDDKAAS